MNDADTDARLDDLPNDCASVRPDLLHSNTALVISVLLYLLSILYCVLLWYTSD